MASEELERLVAALRWRYGGTTLEMISASLLPLQIPIAEHGKTPQRINKRWGVPFRIDVGTENPHLFRGRTGKVVSPGTAGGTAVWEELVKARIHVVEPGRSTGELHYGGRRSELETRIAALVPGAVLEIDRFGAAAKVESALAEAAFVEAAHKEGFQVTRMPEDVARHLGSYYNFDFQLTRDGVTRRIENKSLWGTDPRLARLIKSKTLTHKTSSCRFDAQDFFAVNLWLRTGRITDFAFARSRPRDVKHPYGLPESSISPDYVHQNPSCKVGDGVWYGTLAEVWELE